MSDLSNQQQAPILALKQFERDEDKFMAIMASEMADQGSTGVGLSIDQIVDVMKPVPPSVDSSDQ